jgi:hypothetical protein
MLFGKVEHKPKLEPFSKHERKGKSINTMKRWQVLRRKNGVIAREGKNAVSRPKMDMKGACGRGIKSAY